MLIDTITETRARGVSTGGSWMRQIDIGKSAEIRELKHAQKETVSRADEVEPRTCWKSHPIRTSNRIPTPEVSLGRKLTLLMLPLIALPIAHPHPRQLLGIVSDSISSEHGYPLASQANRVECTRSIDWLVQGSRVMGLAISVGSPKSFLLVPFTWPVRVVRIWPRE